MLQYMLMILMVTSAMVFMLVTQPLSKGIMLLINTLFTATLTGLMMPSFWYSYIIFIVFVGGLLVLFMYMTSMSSNIMLNLNSLMMISITSLLLFITPLLVLLNDLLLGESFNLLSDYSMMSNNYFKEMFPINLSISMLYNAPSNSITILLVIYLFLALLAVAVIINNQQGPLRAKF
uniref:NADH-ubiquinone oxidoreductase chain 6 n=1 Tax=Mirhipipteryx andensis TaxID=1564103 RepID=A0A0N7AY95_9ORTH|nr:NADH dehydrogenase subunit 6 [Mirhipipteryx andensis]AJW76430.1 NADH dehydrogenase subunit 6 [Mirhipipteryx andensis]